MYISSDGTAARSFVLRPSYSVHQVSKMSSAKKVKVYQPKSLLELSKLKTRETYRFNWQVIIDSLPKILQLELLQEWLQCDEQLPSSDEERDRILQFFTDRYIRWESLSTEEFLYIMQHPEEVPDFAYQTNHCQYRK